MQPGHAVYYLTLADEHHSCRLGGFEEIFFSQASGRRLFWKESGASSAVGCIVLTVGVRRILLPKRAHFTDNVRVCKEGYDGNLLVTGERLTHACAGRRGAEREREKETQMVLKYGNIRGRKINSIFFYFGYKNKVTLACVTKYFLLFVQFEFHVTLKQALCDKPFLFLPWNFWSKHLKVAILFFFFK